MIIKRCSDQTRQTLVGFYEELASSPEPVTSVIGQNMLALLSKMEDIMGDLKVWGLTSHYLLSLLSEDRSESPTYVSIHALPEKNHFEISYLIPEDQRPWEQAEVTGRALSVDSALEMIQIGIFRSEGWSTEGRTSASSQ